MSGRQQLLHDELGERPDLTARLFSERHGTAALEEVMLLAIMLPLVAGAFWLAQDMCVTVYKIISTLVGWPVL